jgi:RimJ/RimL family protein N-acetyltransferase
MTGLLLARDADFLWMMGEDGCAAPHGLVLAEGGIEQAPVLDMLRGIAAEVAREFGDGAWIITDSGEAVGLISFIKTPDADGAAEIGYGVAASRRGRGYAARAVVALVARLRDEGRLRALTAATATHNVASQKVLIRAGFEQTGARHDAEDGDMITWRLGLK